MKQFCLRGHDTFLCGRNSKRFCRACGTLAVSQWGKIHRAQRNAATQRQRLRRRQEINEMKDHPCVDCGIKYPPYIMQFDHLDSSQKIRDVSKWLTSSFSGLIKEIEKCELVCANCHAVRTHCRREALKEN